ncbi:MAG: DUF1007 family protein [Hyphomicrobiaceae bacterium]
MMKIALAKFMATLAIMLSIASAAQAHPHMFFNSTAEFILDGQGRLSKLRVVFLIDELNTVYTFAELGVNKDGNQELSDEEKHKIAQNVLEGFGHYRYFTHLRDQNGAIALGKPRSVTVQLDQLRLGLAFLIPLETPLVLSGRSISLQLYDPTYFTAITIDLPPTVVGSGTECSVSVSQPSDTEQTRRSQLLLSQLSREQTPQIENVGAVFAATTRLKCQE